MGFRISVTDEIGAYIETIGMRNHPVLRRCERMAIRKGFLDRQIAHEQGAMLGILARAMGVKRYLEIGTLFGYSSLAVGLALPKNAKAICLDIDPEGMEAARAFWAEAGISKVMEGRVGDARKTLRKMIADREKPFDMMFIDADKKGYPEYFEFALKLTRRGGLIILDNMLREGHVAYPKQRKRDRIARWAHTLNRKLHRDKRVDIVLLPVGDGITLACKR